jgi:hypothetical protein
MKWMKGLRCDPPGGVQPRCPHCARSHGRRTASPVCTTRTTRRGRPLVLDFAVEDPEESGPPSSRSTPMPTWRRRPTPTSFTTCRPSSTRPRHLHRDEDRQRRRRDRRAEGQQRPRRGSSPSRAAFHHEAPVRAQRTAARATRRRSTRSTCSARTSRRGPRVVRDPGFEVLRLGEGLTGHGRGLHHGKEAAPSRRRR